MWKNKKHEYCGKTTMANLWTMKCYLSLQEHSVNCCRCLMLIPILSQQSNTHIVMLCVTLCQTLGKKWNTLRITFWILLQYTQRHIWSTVEAMVLRWARPPTLIVLYKWYTYRNKRLHGKYILQIKLVVCSPTHRSLSTWSWINMNICIFIYPVL
jgi:hypothetical protein